MTVSQLLDNTSSADLSEWAALYSMEHDDRQRVAARTGSADVEGQLLAVFGKRDGR